MPNGDEDETIETVVEDASESDWEDEELAGLSTLPPGEEAFLQSHAGGEAMLQEVMDGVTMYVLFTHHQCPELTMFQGSELITAHVKIAFNSK